MLYNDINSESKMHVTKNNGLSNDIFLSKKPPNLTPKYIVIPICMGMEVRDRYLLSCFFFFW